MDFPGFDRPISGVLANPMRFFRGEILRVNLPPIREIFPAVFWEISRANSREIRFSEVKFAPRQMVGNFLPRGKVSRSLARKNAQKN
jgi:hypothetical protein